MDISSLHLIIKGKVQGVNFRMATVAQAKHIGLTGWVRNLPDGSVETVAMGDEKNLQAFKIWCQRGPARAQVTEVIVIDSLIKDKFDCFDIRF